MKYLTGEEILPSNRQQIIEQVKFTYSPLRKAFEKQIKTIEDQGQKHVKALEDLESKSKSIEGIFTDGYESSEIKNKVDEIKEYEENINRKHMIYNSSKESFDFNTFKTIRTFGEDIYNNKITIIEADQEQGDLVNYISNFNNKARPRSNIDKKKLKKYFRFCRKSLLWQRISFKCF